MVAAAAVPSSTGLRPKKLVQVECNAPLSSVPTLAERAATEAVPDAAMAAAAMSAKAAEKAHLERRAMAKFRQDTLVRLREKAKAKRDALHKEELVDMARKYDATSAGVIQRAPPSPTKSAAAADQPSSDIPAEPSQLDLMRYGLTEQAYGARDLMLARCEQPVPFEYSDGGFAPDAVDVSIEGGAPRGKGGGGGAAPRVEPSANATSMLRAVASTAAKADRQGARASRLKKEAEAKRALERAELVEAVMAEREAAEEAAALRQEVAMLEAEAQLKEEEAAVASVHAAANARYQKVVEAERYFDALREKLREEAARAKRPLPPLCSCGLDPLENHTEQCARNCIFFNNPVAYGRALSGLFVRPIVLD